MTSSLPPRPSVENLKKQAKALKKAWQDSDPAAIQRIRQFLQTSTPRLADCQFVLAREFGFKTWRELRVAAGAAGQLPDQFVSIACLCYDDPHFDHRSYHARAYQTLRDNPWLTQANVWSAAAAGNAAAVKALITEEPELVNKPGPHGWSPLFCTCYSRVEPIDPAHSTYEATKILLAHGADPNAYTLKGNADERLDQTARRFSALTGLFGGGSTGMANEPAHPHWRAMAELLLEHGASPADQQAVRISQDHPGTYAKLEVLLHHGLTPEAEAGGLTLMGRALSQAVLAGDMASAKLLLAYHARADEPFRGKTPWRHAVDRGHLAMARLLEESGAPTAQVPDVERFVSLCLAGEEREVRAMLERAPDLLSRAPRELALKASGTGRIKAVELVLDLGFDPNYMDEITALHNAAGADQEIMRLLIARGGSLTIREPFYDGTPVGWADFFDHREMRDMLLNEGEICIFDALNFDRLDRIPDILARDPAALNRPFAQCLSREPKPEDWQTPVARMLEQGKTEAVALLMKHGATLP